MRSCTNAYTPIALAMTPRTVISRNLGTARSGLDGLPSELRHQDEDGDVFGALADEPCVGEELTERSGGASAIRSARREDDRRGWESADRRAPESAL